MLATAGVWLCVGVRKTSAMPFISYNIALEPPVVQSDEVQVTEKI